MSEHNAMIKARSPLSVTRQCQLLAVLRSSVYARPQNVSEADVELMGQIDELYLKRHVLRQWRLRDELQQRRQGCWHQTLNRQTPDAVSS
jgi:hypothetical protein